MVTWVCLQCVIVEFPDHTHFSAVVACCWCARNVVVWKPWHRASNSWTRGSHSNICVDASNSSQRFLALSRRFPIFLCWTNSPLMKDQWDGKWSARTILKLHVFYLGETSSAMDSWLWSQADEGCLEQVPKNSPSSHQQSLHESETWAMVADKFKHIHSNYDPQYHRTRKLSQTPFS